MWRWQQRYLYHKVSQDYSILTLSDDRSRKLATIKPHLCIFQPINPDILPLSSGKSCIPRKKHDSINHPPILVTQAIFVLMKIHSVPWRHPSTPARREPRTRRQQHQSPFRRRKHKLARSSSSPPKFPFTSFPHSPILVGHIHPPKIRRFPLPRPRQNLGRYPHHLDQIRLLQDRLRTLA
jgi:hypothetical protein